MHLFTSAWQMMDGDERELYATNGKSKSNVNKSANPSDLPTRSSAIAEGPRDASVSVC